MIPRRAELVISGVIAAVILLTPLAFLVVRMCRPINRARLVAASWVRVLGFLLVPVVAWLWVIFGISNISLHINGVVEIVLGLLWVVTVYLVWLAAPVAALTWVVLKLIDQRSKRAAITLLLISVLVPPVRVGAQDTTSSQPAVVTRREVIRGQVTSDSGVPIPNADVVITRAPDRAFKSTQTSADGRYEIVWDDGTGDYLVHIAALGRKNFRQRVTRSGSDSVFVVNAKLESSIEKMETVKVEAQTKPKPERGAGHEAGAAETFNDGVSGAVPPDLAGDLARIAATVPGVTQVPGGISVLGLGPSQNTTTLNGMSFGGADIPSDVQTRVRVTTSTYDPARGWFSGANTNVELGEGFQFSQLTTHATIDAPALQSTDRISSRLGERYSNLQLGIGGEGPLDSHDRYFYSFGAEANHHTAPTVSLLDADAALLERVGVSSDSVARFLNLLDANNIPVSAAGFPQSLTSQDVKVLLRLDHAPYDWKSLTPAKTTWGLTGYEKISDVGQTASGVTSLTEIPTFGGKSSQHVGHLEGMYSSYFHTDWLEDLRSAFTTTRDVQLPYVRLPAGQVLVASDLSDGNGGISDLSFGGNSALESETRQWTWETTSETQFYAHNKATHRIKLNADSRLDGFARDAPGNQLGTFSFNSLGEFAQNEPATFTRSFGEPTRRGEEWNGFAAVGDLWKVSPSFSLLYGARLEGNAFTRAPAYNPEIDRVFGERTDHAPNTIHVSPRIGFTWTRHGGGNGFAFGPLGHFNIGPTSFIRGGIGEFRTMLSPALLADASALTGLPGSAQMLTCIGAAAPTPDWTSYAADPSTIPFRCQNGAAALTDSAPAVQLFDRKYNAPRSWRANLNYTSTFWQFVYSLEGTYSLNLDQPGIENLNFTGAPRFTLSGEGRPIYVTPQSIDPASGAVSAVESRLASRFGAVIDNRSDLRSIAKQFIISATPDLEHGWNRFYLRAAYVLSSVRSDARGFDNATFGNPAAREWGRSPLDVRHQIQIQGGATVKNVGLTFFSVLQSGIPFTPIIGGDINGDGFANDRAFVFNPATTSDPAFAAQLRSLYASLPRSVSHCLETQVGAAAGRNSCEGPWTASMNAQINVPGYVLKLPRLQHLAINFSNPLGGIDQLLHGAEHLRGWGTQAFPDPVLYTVRGFDPSTSRFLYQVNPRFGSTRPAQTTLRVPFRVTISASFTLATDIGHQQVDRMLRPGRKGHVGPRLSVDELKQRYSRTINDPYADVLEQSDSLLLTPEQTLAITRAQTRFHQRLDSLLTEFATYMADLPDEYDAEEAYRRQEATTDAGWVLMWEDVRATVPTILSPIQIRLLPQISYMLQMKNPPKGGRTYRMFG
ncbi:MAG: carboxypeptidase regulatory-like domain-containing protein [Gemmatimonadaceae bacterium]